MCKPLVMALGFQYNDRLCWVRQPLSGVQPMGAPYMGVRCFLKHLTILASLHMVDLLY